MNGAIFMPLELITGDDFKIQTKNRLDGFTHLIIDSGNGAARLDIALTESDVDDLIHMLRKY